jgi:hypothetical protein
VLIRLLIFCLSLFALLLVIRAVLALSRNRSKRFSRRGDAEDMVLDPQCHSYLPKEEAILRAGRYFCSRECANLYLSR